MGWTANIWASLQHHYNIIAPSPFQAFMGTGFAQAVALLYAWIWLSLYLSDHSSLKASWASGNVLWGWWIGNLEKNSSLTCTVWQAGSSFQITSMATHHHSPLINTVWGSGPFVHPPAAMAPYPLMGLWAKCNSVTTGTLRILQTQGLLS